MTSRCIIFTINKAALHPSWVNTRRQIISSRGNVDRVDTSDGETLILLTDLSSRESLTKDKSVFESFVSLSQSLRGCGNPNKLLPLRVLAESHHKN